MVSRQSLLRRFQGGAIGALLSAPLVAQSTQRGLFAKAALAGSVTIPNFQAGDPSVSA